MFYIKEYVDPRELGFDTVSHINYGKIVDHYRRYRVEVWEKDGTKKWLEEDNIQTTPEEVYNGTYYLDWLTEHEYTLTGRICFLGYSYNHINLDTYEWSYSPVSDEEAYRYQYG